jgi:hypothetical protein
LIFNYFFSPVLGWSNGLYFIISYVIKCFIQFLGVLTDILKLITSAISNLISVLQDVIMIYGVFFTPLKIINICFFYHLITSWSILVKSTYIFQNIWICINISPAELLSKWLLICGRHNFFHEFLLVKVIMYYAHCPYLYTMKSVWSKHRLNWYPV